MIGASEGSIRFDRQRQSSAIDEGATSGARRHRLRRVTHVIPGLIEMHTDNVERHFEPRPGVTWPSPVAALTAHDAQMVGAGVTTVLDAISVGDYDEDGRRTRSCFERPWKGLAFGIEQQTVPRRSRVCTCAARSPTARSIEIFEPYHDHELVRLVSLMDHTPGQRQWRDIGKMRTFHSKRRSYTDEELDAYIRQAPGGTGALRGETPSRDPGPLAAARATAREPRRHDRGARARGAGRRRVTIAEFPTTLEAARLAHDNGMVNVMGAPNLVRGGSHSGNVSAHELADAGVLSGLSSDYAPVSLLHGMFKLVDDHGFDPGGRGSGGHLPDCGHARPG